MDRSNISSCLTFMLLLSSLFLAYVIGYEYAPKPELRKPKPEEKQVPVPPYNDHGKTESEGLEENIQPNYDQEYHHNVPTNSPNQYYYGHDHHDDKYINNIGIRGLILCQSANNKYALAGAVARITCLAEDENGYEAAPFYTESHETNENGFFFATFLLSDVIGSDKLKLKECRAFLENSPLETCNVPTDYNNGITGALLSSPRFLPEKLMTLYTIGPFIYTSESSSVPDGHY